MPTMYPLDLNANLSGNYVQNQTHTISSGSDRIIILSGGSFYTKDLVVKDASTNQVLIPVIDYRALELNAEASLQSGKEVNSVLYISKPSVTAVSVSCRYIGGSYQNLNPEILSRLANVAPGQLVGVPWSSIIGAPNAFPPAQHTHLPDDWIGHDSMISLLEQIRQAVMHGNEPGLQALIQYVLAQHAEVDLSPDQGNLLEKRANGLYAEVDLSPDAGNLLDMRDNGLYYGIQAPPNISHLYVSTSLGDDTNPGTQSAPLKTLAAALAKVSGDVSNTIHLRAGETYPMTAKVFMSGSAVRSIVPYDDPYYDGAVHDAILADWAQHLQAYTQEINRPVILFDWVATPSTNNTQAFATGGWVCKNSSSVEFSAINLRMAAYPSDQPTVLRSVGASFNTTFLGAGAFTFMGCVLAYEFDAVDNPLGRFFRPSGADATSLTFIGTEFVGAGDRDYMTIVTGSVSINVRDDQATIGGTTTQVVTAMTGTGTTAFTTRPIEGAVWGQDGIPTNVKTNLAISKDGHLPSATAVSFGAVKLLTTGEYNAPDTILPGNGPQVYTATQVRDLLSALRVSMQAIKPYGLLQTFKSALYDGYDVRSNQGYGLWVPVGVGKLLYGLDLPLVGATVPSADFFRVGVAPSYPSKGVYQWMRVPDDAPTIDFVSADYDPLPAAQNKPVSVNVRINGGAAWWASGAPNYGTVKVEVRQSGDYMSIATQNIGALDTVINIPVSSAWDRSDSTAFYFKITFDPHPNHAVIDDLLTGFDTIIHRVIILPA